MRQAYIVHVLDQVLCERQTIAENDEALRVEEEEEENKDGGERITLDNVFDLAKQQEKENSSGDEDDEDEEAGENLRTLLN